MPKSTTSSEAAVTLAPGAAPRAAREAPMSRAGPDPTVAPAGKTESRDPGEPLDEVEVQRVADPLALRAIAHPKRLALLDLLLVEGTATATRCAQVLGDSPSSWSFHLRTLARYKLVEEAPGGVGRRRPWRLASLGQSWSNLGVDPESRQAADELDQVFVQREVAGILTWLRARRAYPEQWQRAAHVVGVIAYLTPEELSELGEALGRLLHRRGDRLTDPARRPKGARLVRLLGFGFPLPPATEEAPSDSAR